MTIRKVYKSYNIIARNNTLFVKINNLTLGNVMGHGLYKVVLEEIFKRRHELEITRVQKDTIETWAWLVAPYPAQTKTIIKYKTFLCTIEIIQNAPSNQKMNHEPRKMTSMN